MLCVNLVNMKLTFCSYQNFWYWSLCGWFHEHFLILICICQNVLEFINNSSFEQYTLLFKKFPFGFDCKVYTEEYLFDHQKGHVL